MANPYPIPRSARQTGILLGNGGATYGPFDGLKAFDIEDIAVYTRPQGQTAFARATATVSKTGGQAFDFFTVTFPAGLPVTTQFVVSSERVAERSAGVEKGTLLNLSALEKELSKQATVLQEVRRDVDRAFRVQFGQSPAPVPAAEDDRVLGWEGGQLVNLDPAQFVNAAGLATATQGAKADGAVQRSGNETKTGNFRLTAGLLKLFMNLQAIPTIEDNAGTVISHNRSAGDAETNIRNMFINAYGPSLAFVFSQITAAGMTEDDLLRIYRNGQIKNGGGGWLEALAGQTETIAQLAILSKPGSGMPIIGAVRTSDLVAPAYFAGQGLFGYCINDRARGVDFDHTFAGWGGYFEMRRKPGSGRSHGIEVGTVNENDGSDAAMRADPFNYGQNNQISSLWNSAGRPDVGPNQRDIDVGGAWIQNGPSGTQVSYSVGLLFGDKSVREVSGVAPVMRMPTRYQIEWWTTEGLRAYSRSEQSAGAQTIGTVIRNNTLDIEHQGSVSVGISSTGVRAPATNGGFDAESIYIGSPFSGRQWQFAAGSDRIYLNNNTGSVGAPVWSNRAVIVNATGVYTATSARSLKRDFRPWDDARDLGATADGIARAVSHFRMKADPREEELGFVADDLIDVLPEAVLDVGGIPYLKERPVIAVHSLQIAELYRKLKTMETIK